ncbi:hypothetical protein [Streptomyces marispadix]|uniref:DUF2742 domain-containing protein n=1 Tax=Streptomyces marispadix TaxID=2922868 RepID=A0ABS9T0F5_9ACTN|nr:hypothetical protein [Streptomyces marispadix]MCH6162015.1 hypothetical protein [Streptomyces marispadix]
MSSETEHAAQVAAVWAENTVTNLLDGAPEGIALPEYGTPEWARLTVRDPRRSAAVITAAELWRRHATEQARLDALLDADPIAYFREVTADADHTAARLGRALASTPTHSELVQRRKLRPPHPVTATPGWPVRLPGRPGWWRHCIDGEQVDLPYRDFDAPERRNAA